ncbi:MAG: hypothetical protein LJE91_09595 [Gammaproteobacteria bacterium]|nr:hypothetical protein [Gammaproteobacteria bacterium]
MADRTQVDPQPRGNGALLRDLLGMSLAALVFWTLSRVFLDLDCLVLFPVLAILAWPIWEYQREYALFHRRVVLDGVTRPESRVRGLFWAGTITLVFQAALSLILAAASLVLATHLTVWHWAVLALDVPLLLALVAPANRLLASEVRPERLAMASRRWPLLALNGALIAAAFLAIDFSTGAPDTRAAGWDRVAESAFTRINDGAACRLSGWSAGAAHAIDALSWHATQLLIPGLPGTGMRFAAWAVFLLQAGAIAYIYTRMLLGVGALLERRLRDPSVTASGAFIATILVLAVPYFYATVKLSRLDPAVFGEPARHALGWIDPCRNDTANAARIAAELDSQLERERQEAITLADERIEQGVEELFADVEKGVDAYLDWYFTVLGEYERLLAVFGGDVAQVMAEQVETHLFGKQDFTKRLQRLNQEVSRQSRERVSNVASRLSVQAQTALNDRPCGLSDIDLTQLTGVDRDSLRASAAAASGTAVGVVTAKALAGKTASAVVGKIATKKSFQTAAALTTKAVAKKGGSILVSAAGAAAICSPGGALALVCGFGAGVATWLAVDKVLIEVDEALNREEMRAEMLSAIREQQRKLTVEMKDKHRLLIDAMAGQIQEAVGRTFVPARDGL